jgi:molybdopterin/thiamine biosynthesis adenylyltransferase
MEPIFPLTAPIVLSYPPYLEVVCRPRQVNQAGWPLTDRQERIPWWNQKKIHDSSVLLVGAGGLGGNLGKIFTQMGFGQLDLVDPDLVEDSNRNRQLFTADDVGKPKTHSALRNLKPYAVHNTILRGFFTSFEEWESQDKGYSYNAVCCGVDSVPTMVAVARYGLRRNVPVVFINVSEDGEGCRIFIQRSTSDEPCFGCYRPLALNHISTRDMRCVPVAAIADILQVAVGFGARATVGEILGLPIGDYNCRDISFSGFDVKKIVAKKHACQLCGGPK